MLPTWATFFWLLVFASPMKEISADNADLQAFRARERGLLDLVGSIKNAVLGLGEVIPGFGTVRTVANVISNFQRAKSLVDVKLPVLTNIQAILKSFLGLPSFTHGAVRFLMESVVLIEKQSNFILTLIPGLNVAGPILKSIVFGLQSVRMILHAVDSISSRVVSMLSLAMKAMSSVVEVVASTTEKMACVISATFKRYAREKCKACREMIPDFLDREGAKSLTTSLLSKLTTSSRQHVESLLEGLKIVAGFSSRYLGTIVDCGQTNPSKGDGCRDLSKESTILAITAAVLQGAKTLLTLTSDIGLLIVKTVGTLVERVSSSHSAYKSCLTSGASESYNIQKPAASGSLDGYFNKMKNSMMSLKNVVAHFGIG